MAFWEFMSFMVFCSIMGSFTFWLIGYFAIELIRYVARGPSEQMQSVGTSILDEPEYRPREQLQLPPKAA